MRIVWLFNVHVHHVAPMVLEGDGWPEARLFLDAMARELGEGAVAAIASLLPSVGGDTRSALSSRSTIAEVIRDVCAETGVPDAELRSHSRRQEVAWARQRVMHLASLEGFSTTQIGHVLLRDHTTVMHGIAAEAERLRRGALDGVS